MVAKDVPTVIEIVPDYIEKLYMEDCRFDGVTGPAIVISQEGCAPNQINLRSVVCRGVPVLARFRQSGKEVQGAGPLYRVAAFTHGVQMDALDARPEVKTTLALADLLAWPEPEASDIPPLPPMDTWVNLRDLGAKGDEVTDDTKVLQETIEKHRVIYLPEGRYRVSGTITLKPDTVLIGLHPIATQILIADNTEAFAGFGPPKPLLEAPKGGTNIVYGIGLDVGGRNPRAVGCKWMAGARSYMNDVKFVGGHGGMNTDGTGVQPYNASRTADANPDRKWDSLYWSLWVTDGGGGVFKDIWTASPYAAAGLYVSDTTTPGRIYGMSSEHHVLQRGDLPQRGQLAGAGPPDGGRGRRRPAMPAAGTGPLPRPALRQSLPLPHDLGRQPLSECDQDVERRGHRTAERPQLHPDEVHV